MAKVYRNTCVVLLSLIGICTCLLIMYYMRSYTVTFDTKGGTIYPAVQVKAGESVTKPEDPLMEGYVFVGWYTGASEEEYDFNSKVDRNITITAKWQSIF